MELTKTHNLKSYLVRRLKTFFFSSNRYWNKRYKDGGHSGAGSYAHLAEFKAEVLNGFVKTHDITGVIEFGCGDGNQLSLLEFPVYLGYDVSPVIISACKQRFDKDSTKEFNLVKDYNGEKAQLVLSLDVIFHLVEDGVFDEYMRKLFRASNQYVIIYSSNKNEPINAVHVKHRKFTDWVESNCPEFDLFDHIPNKYPFVKDDGLTSFADFYMFKKKSK